MSAKTKVCSLIFHWWIVSLPECFCLDWKGLTIWCDYREREGWLSCFWSWIIEVHFCRERTGTVYTVETKVWEMHEDGHDLKKIRLLEFAWSVTSNLILRCPKGVTEKVFTPLLCRFCAHCVASCAVRILCSAFLSGKEIIPHEGSVTT